MPARIAVVGGGWAGIAAAVAGTAAGDKVTLFEMAPQLGGRARRVEHASGPPLDNGQHILIGAYRETLSLMRQVGVDPEAVLYRTPLVLVGPNGLGLRLPPGPPATAFVRAVLAHAGWSWGERLGLLALALQWRARGFQTNAGASVDEVTGSLSERVRRTFIEPLCVAALNTPADKACARTFLRVLQDALFSGPGASDMLLPRTPLSSLLPDPAFDWLMGAGADIRLTTRVQAISTAPGGWTIDGEPFDAIVLACSAHEASRLAASAAPAWSLRAAALEYESIVTVYARSEGTRLPHALTALQSDSAAPAQFVCDLGAISGGGARDGLFAFVTSGAGAWIARGLEVTAEATLAQADRAFDRGTWVEPLQLIRTIAERRATFLCRPALDRPNAVLADGLVAAGDYIASPYPATLEGAVRSGTAAIKELRQFLH